MSDKWPPEAAWSSPDSWKRWEMGAFDLPKRKSALAALAPPPLPPELNAEIERIRQAAHAEARAEGYAAGHAQGLAEGIRAGTESGHQEGYQAGFAEGRAAGSEVSQQEAGQLATLLTTCADALESVEADMGQNLISLAIDIARQVLRSTLAAEPEKMLDTVRDILHDESDPQDKLQLRVHPADLELIQTHLTDDPAFKNWRLISDDSIERGGCIAATARGDIDATLETRWRRITAALGQDHPWRTSL